MGTTESCAMKAPPFSEWGGTQKRQVLKPASPPIATSL